jgi:FixJ family two-component response regulator
MSDEPWAQAMDFAVFLVDDDVGVLKGLSRLVRAGGYQAYAYSSPEQFLAEYDRTLPGCVVVDLAMPGMDGLDLQSRLMAVDPGRPVVFLTGTGDEPVAARATKAGALAFLTKPVDQAALFAALERARERYAQRAEGA